MDGGNRWSRRGIGCAGMWSWACGRALMSFSMAETQRGRPGDAAQEEAAARARRVIAVSSGAHLGHIWGGRRGAPRHGGENTRRRPRPRNSGRISSRPAPHASCERAVRVDLFPSLRAVFAALLVLLLCAGVRKCESTAAAARGSVVTGWLRRVRDTCRSGGVK